MKDILFRISKFHVVEHFLFLMLAIMAAYFTNERLVADSGYYLFRVINDETLWVEHNRYILIFSQIIPLLAVKIGLGLKAVLYCYSVGIVVFFYGIFLICKNYYDNRQAGLLLILLQTLGITSGFFVPMFELYFAGAFLVLMASMLHSDKRNIFLLVVLSFFILTAHPVALFLYLFVFGHHFIKYRWRFWKLYLIAIGTIIIVSVFKSYNATDYEIGKTQAFFNNLYEANYGGVYIKLLGQFMLNYYWETLFLGGVVLMLFLFSSSYLRALLTLITFFIVLGVANITYYGFIPGRYQEQVYFGVTFVVGYALFVYVMEKKTNMAYGILTFITLIVFGIRTNKIIEKSSYFSERLDEMRGKIVLAEEQQGDKFFIPVETLQYEANWSYSIETMFLSAQQGPKNTISICVNSDLEYAENKEKLTSDKYLFRMWEIYPLDQLNDDYFQLSHGLYMELKED